MNAVDPANQAARAARSTGVQSLVIGAAFAMIYGCLFAVVLASEVQVASGGRGGRLPAIMDKAAEFPLITMFRRTLIGNGSLAVPWAAPSRIFMLAVANALIWGAAAIVVWRSLAAVTRHVRRHRAGNGRPR
jgi:hypothetical protein